MNETARPQEPNHRKAPKRHAPRHPLNADPDADKAFGSNRLKAAATKCDPKKIGPSN